jgi:hypothetical protein
VTIRGLGLVLGIGLVLTGCGQATSPVAGGTAPPAASPAGSPPSPAGSPSPSAAATPELPPGDPGPDAPSVPDPGEPEHEHAQPARTTVPVESMLDAGTVSGVLGGRWQPAPGGAGGCALAPEGVARRTVGYDSGGGYLAQTVTTHRSPAAADREVRRAAQRIRACGWRVLPDPRLGSASVAATKPGEGRAAVVVAVEGVTVTLVGSGAATRSAGRWSGLADIALGNACAAAPDGCH